MKTLGLAISCLCVSIQAHAVGISGQGTWETTLQGRDLDGVMTTAEAYYDTVLGITWLADANYAQTSSFSIDGLMTWSAANTWASNLNINSYTGWRLPTVTDVGNDGCQFAYSGTDCGYNVDTATGEMAHMFYTTLGDKSFYYASGIGGQPGYGLTNTGPFSNVKADAYWSDTGVATSTINAWSFAFHNGGQYFNGKASVTYAWAVHDGDVGASTVPVPAAAWLFGSGLLGLIGVVRKNSAQ